MVSARNRRVRPPGFVVWVLVVRLGGCRLVDKPPPIFRRSENLVGIKYLLDQRPRFRAIFVLPLANGFSVAG